MMRKKRLSARALSEQVQPAASKRRSRIDVRYRACSEFR